MFLYGGILRRRRCVSALCAGFFGAVVKVQSFGRSLHVQHRAGSSVEDDIRECIRCSPMAMDSVDDGDCGAILAAV